MDKTEKFIIKSINIHGNKYDYSLTNYKKNNEKVKIICKEHGVFEQKPSYHLDKCGCPKCCKTVKLTNEIFIKRSIEAHGDIYEYSLVDYKSDKIKVKIICKKHGIFEQRPTHHFSGNGCPFCSNNRPLDKNLLIERSNKIHNYKYDYSLVEYNGINNKIKIICKEHGVFEQAVNNHINLKQGCKKCFLKSKTKEKKIKPKIDKTIAFINKAVGIHGNMYNYNEVHYINCESKVKIVCKKHGIFNQTPSKHLKGQGCPNCKNSLGELKIKELLDNNNIIFKQQFSFADLKYKRYLYFDFCLFDKQKNIKCLIEYNGIQHYYLKKSFHKTEEIFNISKIRDQIKIDYCKENNIPLFVIKYDENIKRKMENIFEYILS